MPGPGARLLLSWHGPALACARSRQFCPPFLTAVTKHSDSNTSHAGESHCEEICDFIILVKRPPAPSECQLPELPTLAPAAPSRERGSAEKG